MKTNKYAILLVLFAVVLMLCAYQKRALDNGRQITIECRIKIATLQEKIYWLNQVNDLTVALYQILTPEQIEELRIMAEKE